MESKSIMARAVAQLQSHLSQQVNVKKREEQQVEGEKKKYEPFLPCFQPQVPSNYCSELKLAMPAFTEQVP